MKNKAYYIKKSLNGLFDYFEVGELFVVGSDPRNGLCLLGDGISDRHCRIEKREGYYLIRDLKSSSGTFVNGTQVIEAILHEGDEILIGEYILWFTGEKLSLNDEYKLSSKNENWSKQVQALPHFADSELSVLLLGPSGSGKEILARSIHALSARKLGPFVSVNCSALTETLIESELFGHIKGSFTGAIADRKGAFEAARGGTLFLDEIGDLPYSLQAKLLRALENGEIRPVGSDKIIKTDVRIVAATHQNLHSQIQNKGFRADLYYRLNVINMSPPALSERMEDFEDIFYALCKQIRVRFGFNAINLLKKYSWPGNIRELKNFILRAKAYYPGQSIDENMAAHLLQSTVAEPADLSAPPETSQSLSPQGNIIKEIERQMIVKRLSANRGNQRRTAHDLGIPKSTLHDRLKTYNIDVSSFRA